MQASSFLPTEIPMPAAAFGAETGSYFLGNTAPRAASQGNTNMSLYNIESVEPFQPTTQWQHQQQVGAVAPSCVAQPVLFERRKKKKNRRHRSRHRRKKRRPVVVMANVEAATQRDCSELRLNTLLPCMLSALSGVLNDLLNWNTVAFPAGATSHLEKLIFIVTREDRLKYLGAAGVLIIVISHFLRR